MKTQNKIIIASLILAIYLISFASALTISSVKSSPNEISPGEKVDVMLRIENNQNNDASLLGLFRYAYDSYSLKIRE